MIHGIIITPFDAASILIVLAAILGYLGHRFSSLPPSADSGIRGFSMLVSRCSGHEGRRYLRTMLMRLHGRPIR